MYDFASKYQCASFRFCAVEVGVTPGAVINYVSCDQCFLCGKVAHQEL